MGVNDSFIKLYQHYDPDPHEMNEVNCNLKQVRVVPLTWPELEPLPPVPFSFPGMEATAELPFINHSISNIKDILVCIFRLFIQEPYLCCLSDKNLHGYCSISRASRIFSGGGGGGSSMLTDQFISLIPLFITKKLMFLRKWLSRLLGNCTVSHTVTPAAYRNADHFTTASLTESLI